jgi:hypothetical protein
VSEVFPTNLIALPAAMLAGLALKTGQMDA